MPLCLYSSSHYKCFRRMRKFTESNYSFVTSACPYEIIRLPPDGFSWNLISEHISKIFPKKIYVLLIPDKNNEYFTQKPMYICDTAGVVQRVGRGIALLFHDRGTRREWVVSSTPRPHFTPGKDPVPILQEAGWAPGPVWIGGKSRPRRDSIPGRPARSQSLYRLSYRAHNIYDSISLNYS